MPRRTSAADATPVRVVIVTLDTHFGSAMERAAAALQKEVPGLDVRWHAASEWGNDPAALARCHADIAQGDIVLAAMLFLEDHVQAVLPQLLARRAECDAMIGCMSAGEIIRLTRIGRFDMSKPESGALAWLKRLRGSKGNGSSSGAKQLAMMKRIPRLLRFVPGTAQDVRSYFLVLQYWLAGSEDNLANLLRHLVTRYADGPRSALRGSLRAPAPTEYPEVGAYHPRLKGRVTDAPGRLPQPAGKIEGTVGLLVLRSYVLAGNTAHYDGVIEAFEARGLRVVPVFASGLDARPAIERFFMLNGHACVDAVVSLTGFSLVGGPAYNDAHAAEEVLAQLDVPYVVAQPMEFQSMSEWEASSRGLTPLETTMMVALPELDGAIAPIVFGGRGTGGARDMSVHPERAAMLVARVAKMVRLRRRAAAERQVAIVIFNFPPNAGSVGTAAYLDVFRSLYNTLAAMREAGYDVRDLPADADALREALLGGNAQQHGAAANVCARIAVDDYLRREPHLAQIEAQWGPAPGKHQSDGRSIHVLGLRLGKVLVAVQPAFGYEGDPMRLLFAEGFAPTHAFSAFYRYLREDFAADVCLHFGTHGALEFMPGKQSGLSSACWPDRLIGDLPNLYLYAANNPSEGTLAKRRAGATLVSYLTPPVTHAGLYRGLAELKSTIQRWRGTEPEARGAELHALILDQAEMLDLLFIRSDAESDVETIDRALTELEMTLIPSGLHVVGEAPDAAARADVLAAIAACETATAPPRAALEALVAGESRAAVIARCGTVADGALLDRLSGMNEALTGNAELAALLHALAGRYVRPAPGGDLLRTPEILPTGRNLHAFDPFRMPSVFASNEGARHAELLLARLAADGRGLPESVAIVLWGTDNIKNEGIPMAQALALLGARPRFDSYARLCGAELVPLAELGRPRIDVVITLSGIFRDLLPLQTRVLAEACLLAASAEESSEQNFVRKHALAYQAAQGCDFATAALRVFSNADGAYGANVNQLIEAGTWQDESELAAAYTARKCFAYGVDGRAVRQPEMLASVLSDVSVAYQNLESVELGVTTIDHYFDTLGGIGRAVQRERGEAVAVYIGDQTSREARVRTLDEQVALEARTRTLNPKWYESMLAHGYEGVRHIETHVTNTMGWSATTGQVSPWVYQRLTETYILDESMRERIAGLNAQASMRLAHRLLEAHERNYWTPDEATLAALRSAGDAFEDRLEGIVEGVAA
ncbi:MAG: magnesium chelatase subunit H [Gammaproteobacteria bacterium]